MDYIHINSIDDIKPEKISIRQLNNKYIDRYGNRYATKFNIKTRSVEIVRLASTRDEALRYREEIRRSNLQRKKETTLESSRIDASNKAPDYFKSDDSFEDTDSFYEGTETAPPAGKTKISAGQEPAGVELDPYLQDVNMEGSQKFTRQSMSGIVFYEKPFIDKCLEEIHKTRERQNAVINHIKKTKIFEKDHKERLDELEREIDLECWQRGEESVNYHRELYSYPRPITYYMTRMTGEKKKLLESRKEEAEKLDLVRRWEIQDNFETTFNKFIEITQIALMLLQEIINKQDFKTYPAQIQQMIKDASTSCEIIIQNSRGIIKQINIWRNKYS